MDDIVADFLSWHDIMPPPHLNYGEENDMDFNGLTKKRIKDITREELDKVISVRTGNRRRDIWNGGWCTDYETHFLLGDNYVCSFCDSMPTDSSKQFFKLYDEWTKCSKYARLNERSE